MKQGRRNHGYGRRLDYAGRQVLRERYGGGHFASQQTQSERWNRIARWLRAEHRINDMRDVTPEHIREWANERHANGLTPKTVQNEVSCVNVILGHASRGVWQALSPSELAGPRNDVRRVAPASYNADIDRAARAALAPHARAAAVYGLAHATGMRSREAALGNLDRLVREGQLYNAINVQEGAKGGRTEPRWVPLTEHGHTALQAALDARPAGSRNLLCPSGSYAQWRNGELRSGRDALHGAGVRGYHDARAAYACARYRDLTGHEAPAVAGERSAARDADQTARTVIAAELGHGRIGVMTAYVGSAA